MGNNNQTFVGMNDKDDTQSLFIPTELSVSVEGENDPVADDSEFTVLSSIDGELSEEPWSPSEYHESHGTILDSLTDDSGSDIETELDLGSSSFAFGDLGSSSGFVDDFILDADGVFKNATLQQMNCDVCVAAVLEKLQHEVAGESSQYTSILFSDFSWMTCSLNSDKKRKKWTNCPVQRSCATRSRRL